MPCVPSTDEAVFLIQTNTEQSLHLINAGDLQGQPQGPLLILQRGTQWPVDGFQGPLALCSALRPSQGPTQPVYLHTSHLAPESEETHAHETATSAPRLSLTPFSW